MKKSLLGILFCLFILKSGFSQVTINEYCCSNLATTLDNYNEYNDWVELYNANAFNISISGYYLSDNVQEPLKWKIPSGVSIGANGYLLIWADGRNEYTNSNLHSSFKLTQSKKNPDWILLSDATGNLIERLQIRRHQIGHSIGKINSNWQIFPTPTPGNPNSGAYKYAYAASPLFSKSPGFYNNTFRVYFTNTEPNSRIYYTIDGNDPTVSGIAYTSAGILIDSTRVITAVTYSYNPTVIRSFLTFGTFFMKVTHTMPVISIAGTDLNTLANGTKTLRPNGSFEFFDKNKMLQETAYGTFNSHGQDSWANDQRSLDYKCRDEMGYNDAIHQKLFSLSERNDFQGIILRAAGDDNYPASHNSSNAGSAHIRDAYVQNMAIQGHLDLDARTGEKAIVYLNGIYWGVYDMRERADEQDYTKYYYNQDKYDLQYIETWGSTWAQYGGSQAIADWGAIRSFAMTNDMRIAANYQAVIDQIDVKSLVDYAIVNSISVCSDWLNYNTGWWRGLDPKGGHKKWGYTLWDNDAVFGFYINYTGVPTTAYSALPCNIESSSLSDPEGHIDLIIKLRQNPTFNQFYISRYIDLLNTTFSSANMLYNLDSIVNLLDPEMTTHASRWFGTYAEWKANANTLRNYVSNRCNALSGGLNTCYNLSGPYNTTFKTIPLGSGSISINSLSFNTLPYTGRYHGKIDVLLHAVPTKDFVFNYWTAGIDTFKTSTSLAKGILRLAGIDTIVAHFAARTVYPKINFTEINYKPEPTLNCGSWFEITNFGSVDIDISGWKIMQGKWRTYNFPPGSIMGSGAHWVMVSDSTRFNSIYKNSNITKKYIPFDLSTANESLRLIDTSGTEFLSVAYDSKQPWPIAANGIGRNLELKNDSLNCSDVSHWRNGCVGGSPGVSFQNCNEKFIVSEINYNSGQDIDAGTWFEILNTTSQSINLDGIIIRNKTFENKFIVPASVTLNANGRLVFCNDISKFSNFFPTQNVIPLPNYSLANSGDDVRFYSPSDTLLFSVVYDDTLAFSKQANGSGYTLEYNATNNDYSQGLNWNIACLGGSPNGTKGNCVTGIIFTEINYKSAPFNDAGDWIEIKNKSSNTYNLKGWQFTDSTSGGFVIPTNTFLAPNSYLVLTSDSVKFKKMYPHVTNYIGNLNFNLSSAGERIIIYDSLNNFVSFISYDDSIPWPKYIDNRGYTMELRYDTSDFHWGHKWFRGCLGGSPGSVYSNCNDSVIVSEFNFNSDTRANAGDWIELTNKGNSTANISNWLFQDNDLKDTFLIPSSSILNPGERLVIVNDSNKFKSIFPWVKNFIGNFAFGLSSLSDQIVIRDANSKLKFGMVYATDSTWDSLANGRGYTLELEKDSLDRSVGWVWKTKCPSGSPGSIAGTCTENLIITEINFQSDSISNTGDWFEVYNIGTIPISLSKYYISNNDSSKNAIVSNISVLLYAGDYFIFGNDTVALNKFHPALNNKSQVNFALKDTGDEINIYNTKKNKIGTSAYSTAPSWPVMSAGKGFTLEKKNYGNSLNDPNNWEIGCLGGSPGQTKQNCKRNLVISEINYNPKSSEDDGPWIELKNTSLMDTISIQGYSIFGKVSKTKTVFKAPIKIAANSYLVIARDSAKFVKYHLMNLQTLFFDPAFTIDTLSDELSLYTSDDKKIYISNYTSSQTPLLPARGNAYTLEYIDTGKTFYGSNNWFLGCRHGSAGLPYGACISPVVISEINYNSHVKFDMGKWIEIENTANYPLDLGGWMIQNGNSSQKLKSNLLLQPKSYFVVADKLQALKSNYNLNTTLTDSLKFVLAPVDVLKISTDDSIFITQTNYSNALSWPKADGTAYTLEFDDSASTKYSIGCPGGSPGSERKPCFASVDISEINYNSHQKNQSNDWIEIENKNKIPFSIDGWNFRINDSDAVQSSDKLKLYFKGDKAVIVKSIPDFLKTNSVVNVIENSKLNLPDTGAMIKVFDKNTLLLDSVKYSNNVPWSLDANNTGRTLELVNVTENANPEHWIAGCINGTPGANYTSPCAYSLSVSEINFHSNPNYNSGDWIEIYNESNTPIDLIGFKVATTKTTALILSTLTLQPKAYHVFAQNKNQFNGIFPNVTNVSELPAMNLADGDKIELYNPSDNIMYYVSFDTASPWPLNTTIGYTLEYADTAKNPWIASHWFRGCFAGTPGRSYSLPCGINGIKKKADFNSIQIYPNPNSGSFNINTPFAASLSIHDLDGREVMKTEVVEGTNRIEMNACKGMYLITIYRDHEIYRKKIVIE